jgi:Vinculin family
MQGNSPQARTLAANLSQKLHQLKAKLQDALVNQVADDFMDITSPLKALSDAANAPFGIMKLFFLRPESNEFNSVFITGNNQ